MRCTVTLAYYVNVEYTGTAHNIADDKVIREVVTANDR